MEYVLIALVIVLVLVVTIWDRERMRSLTESRAGENFETFRAEIEADGIAVPEDVLRATQAGEPPTSELQRRLFYAHLYLGLYFEATGNQAAAYEHISKASDHYGTDDYMSHVARVHLLLRGKSKGQSPKIKIGSPP